MRKWILLLMALALLAAAGCTRSAEATQDHAAAGVGTSLRF